MLQRKLLNSVEILSVEIDKVRRYLKEAASKIKVEHPKVIKIILFSSFAKKTFTPYSDIDIAIIVKDTIKKKFSQRQDDFIEF